MNNRMNDFEELRERAEEEAKVCASCGRELWENQDCVCVQARQRGQPINRPSTRHEPRQRVIDQLQSLIQQLQPQAELQTVHDSIEVSVPAPLTGQTYEELRRIAQQNPVRVMLNCGGCGQPFDQTEGCPCGHQRQREERLLMEQWRAAYPEQAAWADRVNEYRVGEGLPIGDTRVIFGGTRSGRLSSREPNLSNPPRSEGYAEAMRQGMETAALENMQRQAAVPGSYIRRNHTADCSCMMCSHRRASGRPTVNIACDDCGNHFNLNPALCADGHYVCRACRDARGEPNVPEQRQERCSICDNTRLVAIRNQQNRPICPDCVNAGRHRPPTAASYVYQVVCDHCNARTTFHTLALARRSIEDQSRTCTACGHYSLAVTEVRATDPRLDAERQRELARQRYMNTVSRETERARIPEPSRPQYVSPEPPESPEETRRRIRRGQLENQIRMAAVTGRDVSAQRAELEQMDREDQPVESFVVRRKVELD